MNKKEKIDIPVDEANLIDIDNIDLANITKGKRKPLEADGSDFFDIFIIIPKLLYQWIKNIGKADTIRRFDPMNDQIESTTRHAYHKPPIVMEIDRKDD